MRSCRKPMPARRRVGFTLIEMITAMTIIATIVAIIIRVTVPESLNDRARVDAAADALASLATAIVAREPSKSPTSFKQVIGAHPSKLSQLTIPITTTDRNICNAVYSGLAVPAKPIPPGYTLAWTKPFYYRQLSTAGTILTTGFTTQDALVLIGPAPGVNQASTMAIRMPAIILRDAEALDLSVDGSMSPTTGTIIYNAANDPTSVDYYITISGC
jgi:prepilin-type N-terminal cleavage/methylation domain-containing protein